ncbi:MAG: hypothetical protein C5B51_03435 [Terriglobia bacterium]|nr:MAG: hypothetical protein C5B51_03435 [Terriglobia bacterium]
MRFFFWGTISAEGTVTLTNRRDVLQPKGVWSLSLEQPIYISEGSDMNTDRPVAKAARQLVADKQPTVGQANCYVEPAPLAEVMFDQLEYLVEHSGRDCPPECLDCGRLQQVKNWLLLPFRSSPCAS